MSMNAFSWIYANIFHENLFLAINQIIITVIYIREYVSVLFCECCFNEILPL